MFCLYILYFIILLYMFCDFNYVIRTFFTVISGRLYQSRFSLSDTTTIYGICTFQDCDICFKRLRLARLIREIDFARYHFYDRTGIYSNSMKFNIKSLQGSTLATTVDSINLFVPYKIDTKLAYWDERSLFLEHKVITLHDFKIRYHLISRQHAIGSSNKTTSVLLHNLPGSSVTPNCPQNIEEWLLSLQASSENLRKN